ncbi:hypothetical protein KIKIMORA_02870 [Brevundimonas phage vB_BpoS-Kikimora]|uniref:Uncharacterized protein n=1 Tax=Brevundimonas phage vB_BpoS-Kikimora TaxID=2948601 RepID=A0A9E7MS70_9CAUD|nr:hypothetical protein KIKIMORA_02870 [Brevundimonas phage vB_BpoS-Kikimora]
MNAQSIHILALLILLPGAIASAAWFVLACRFRGGFGVTWRSVALSGAAFVSVTAALVYVLYHPNALPALLGHIAMPPNPFQVS